MRGLGPRASGLSQSVIVMIALVVSHVDAGPRATAVGFDHARHAQQLDLDAKAPLACARCHVLAKGLLVGRPDHATCFTSDCHGAPPVTPRRGARLALDPDRLRLCTNCHAEAALVAPFSGKVPVPYPPYLIDRDFNLSIGHRQHAASPCTDCHAPPETRAPAPVPHARCVGCHDGSRAPAMAGCAGCHPHASGNPQPPELAAVHDTVTAAFSHPRHAARGAAGKSCLTCHRAIESTDDTELPRPTAKDCAAAGCHDGKGAFAVTEACTRCHPAEPAVFTVDRPMTRFSHVTGKHAAVVQQEPCNACHPIAGNAVVVSGHAPCAAAGCHFDDFGARHPKSCGACHDATEPWRQLVADRAPAETTELGATLDHRKHKGACTGCHSLRTQTVQLRPPRGHVACTTSGCHAAEGGPRPHLGECSACHRLGLAAARARARAADPWSVRAAFDHAAHTTGRDGKPLACTACHTDLSAPDVLALAAPAKATCAPCHDGAYAFKLTGTTCTRCHVGKRAAAPAEKGAP